MSYIKRLFLINTGVLASNTKSFLPREIDSPVFAFLIEHANHWILFDTGLSRRIVEDTKYIHKFVDIVAPFRTKKEWLLAAQLPIDPNNIDTIILSHLHFDHTGSVNEFSNATIWIDENEFEKRNSLFSTFRGIKKGDISNNVPIKYPHFTKIKNPWSLFELFDLFDDKSIYIAKTPGHTQGHLSVILNTEPPIFLAADALYQSSSQYTASKIKKVWDLLSTVYYFKNHGLIFATHDHISALPTQDWINLIDPIGIGIYAHKDLSFNEIFA